MNKSDEQESTSKKTRDLPNLTECQACGFRIDSCSGNNKIQILYSEWRIVLLCSKCLHRIESAKICSYCYKETTEDFLTCSQCNRSIHRNCFLKCDDVASLSFLDSVSCIDCWMPNSLVKRREYLTYRKNGGNSADLGNSNSRVSNGGGSCAVVERKIVFGLMARAMMGRKSLVLKKTNPVDSKVKRDMGGEIHKRGPSGDDAELAFQLHRSINSSPRSKNFRLVKPGVSHVRKKGESNGVLMLGGSGSGSSSNNVLKSSGDETSTNFDSRYSYDNHYESTSRKVEICNTKSDRFFFKYRRRNSSRFLLKYRRRNTSRFLLKYRRRSSSLKPVLGNNSDIEKCNQKADRYLFKYKRRDRSSKQTQDDERFVSCLE